jgi:hypothetical protein
MVGPEARFIDGQRSATKRLGLSQHSVIAHRSLDDRTLEPALKQMPNYLMPASEGDRVRGR